MDSTNYIKLCDQFIAGDQHAYASIYKLYAKDMYAFGLSICSNRELVEDAIHDVFIEIYTKKEILKKVNNLKVYFIISFRNRLFYLIKKSSGFDDIVEINAENYHEKDYEKIWIENEDENEKKKRVEAIFDCLNMNQKEAIYLRYIEGLSCQDISKIMSINYQSVKNLIHRSIKKIKSVKATLVVVLATLLQL